MDNVEEGGGRIWSVLFYVGSCNIKSIEQGNMI